MTPRQFVIPLPPTGPERDAVIETVIALAEAYPEDVAFVQALSVGVTSTEAADELRQALVELGVLTPA